jgi:lipoprotein-anchoring transpeptidase ErfK/SrfK
MSRIVIALIFILVGMPAAAKIYGVAAKVDISEQTMNVYKDGRLYATWPVSTARSGKHTPRGVFRAEWLSVNHKSSIYNNAPMPYSIFFNGDYAVHGTDQVAYLGRPASSGCVRLHPDHAAELFAMAKAAGLRETVVWVVE